MKRRQRGRLGLVEAVRISNATEQSSFFRRQGRAVLKGRSRKERSWTGKLVAQGL